MKKNKIFLKKVLTNKAKGCIMLSELRKEGIKNEN